MNRQVNGVQTDRLNWMAEQVAQMGTTSIKVYMGTGDYYDFNNDGRSFPQLLPYTLKQLVTTLQDAETGAHPYDKLFKDPRFETYFLSVYSFGGAQNNWVDGYDCQEYLTERDEIRELGEYLLGNPAYEGKTFILTNWEGDCAFIETPGLRPRWNDFRNYIQAKSDGVRLARASGLINGDFQPGKARLYSAMEYKLTYAIVPGAASYTPYRNDGARVRCGTTGNENYRCLIDTVAPFVNVDYYSYSAYESTNILYPTLNFASCENPESDLKKELRDNLSFSLCVINSVRGNIGAKNFIIGEYNWGVEGIGGDEPSFLNDMFRAIEDADGFPLSYTFFYQALSCTSNIGQLFTASNNKVRTPTGRVFAPWKSLGGIITTSPAVASWETDRLDVFVRGIDSYLYHNFSTDGGQTWTGWGGDYESTITSDPAAISPEKGRIDLFARGPNDDLLYKRYTSAGWSNWVSLGGVISSGPAVASWNPNRLDVFIRGLNEGLWQNTYDGSTWSGWQLRAGRFAQKPAAISRAPGKIDVFARGTDNTAWHRWYDQNSSVPDSWLP